MNIVVLKGNLTKDPEVKTINANGKTTSVAQFSIAVNRHYKKADGSKEQSVTYVDCEAWDTGAETLGKYAKKGDPLLINGALKLDQWETDGQKRSKLKVRVTNFEMLRTRKDREALASAGGAESNDAPTEQPVAPDGQPVDDDIPF